MKIAVITICTSNLEYGKYTIENSELYCKKHGYDFIVYKDLIDPTTCPINNKTISVLHNLDNYDWILMKDADSLFFNFNFKIEDYIDENYNYIGSKSETINIINLGHLLIKCNETTKEELKFIISELKEKVKIKGEQKVYNDLWNSKKISSVKVLKKSIFNANPLGNKWQYRDKKFSSDIILELKDYSFFNDIYDYTFIIHWPGNLLKTFNSRIHYDKILFNFSNIQLEQFKFYNNYIKNLYK